MKIIQWMSLKPRFWDTKKGVLLKAIITSKWRTRKEIFEITKLTQRELNAIISELIDSDLISEDVDNYSHDKTKYWIDDYDLFCEYRDYLQGNYDSEYLSKEYREESNRLKAFEKKSDVKFHARDNAIDDKKHRELMTKYIEYTEKYFENNKELSFEIEKPYNYYGSRGFIDILFSIGASTSICEVKPAIYNLGEAIRQLRRAHDAIMHNAITDFQINDLIYLRLVTHFNEGNVSTLKDSYPILKNIKNLIIDLYCEKTNEFFFITSEVISDYFIEKYGDPLDKRWEMCKKGESASAV